MDTLLSSHRRLIDALRLGGSLDIHLAEFDTLVAWLTGSDRQEALDFQLAVEASGLEQSRAREAALAWIESLLFDEDSGIFFPSVPGFRHAPRDQQLRRFRQIKALFHPDRHPDDPNWATTRAQAVNEAYRAFRRLEQEPAAVQARRVEVATGTAFRPDFTAPLVAPSLPWTDLWVQRLRWLLVGRQNAPERLVAGLAVCGVMIVVVLLLRGGQPEPELAEVWTPRPTANPDQPIATAAADQTAAPAAVDLEALAASAEAKARERAADRKPLATALAEPAARARDEFGEPPLDQLRPDPGSVPAEQQVAEGIPTVAPRPIARYVAVVDESFPAAPHNAAGLAPETPAPGAADRMRQRVLDLLESTAALVDSLPPETATIADLSEPAMPAPVAAPEPAAAVDDAARDASNLATMDGSLALLAVPPIQPLEEAPAPARAEPSPTAESPELSLPAAVVPVDMAPTEPVVSVVSVETAASPPARGAIVREPADQRAEVAVPVTASVEPRARISRPAPEPEPEPPQDVSTPDAVIAALVRSIDAADRLALEALLAPSALADVDGFLAWFGPELVPALFDARFPRRLQLQPAGVLRGGQQLRFLVRYDLSVDYPEHRLRREGSAYLLLEPDGLDRWRVVSLTSM